MRSQPHKITAGPSGMTRILQKAGIRLSEDQTRQLWEFHTFLRRENEKLNLTRIYQFENIVRKHYVDSIIVLRILEEKGIDLPGTILDMGSGAGFPGIPLAIADPVHHYILNDARTVRTDYLGEAIRVAGLKNASVLPKKIFSGFHHPVPAVITRAVASMGETLNRLEGCLSEGGLMIFMKGPHCDGEIRDVRESYGDRAGLLLDHSYTLPDSQDRRRLVVWRMEPTASGTADETENGEETPVHTTRISSADNARYKSWKSLVSSRGIKKQGLAILSGVKLIREFLDDFPEEAEAFLLSPRCEDQENARRPELEYPRVPRFLMDEALFQTLDAAGTGSALLVIRVRTIPSWTERERGGRTLVLPLSNPENLGAALRSAAAFGFTDIILTEEAAHPYLPQVMRASAGQLFKLRLFKGPSLKQFHSEEPLYALDSEGEEIGTVRPEPPFLLVVGEEGQGLPPSLEAHPLRIPMEEGVESLNASVALGIALYELSRNFR